MNHVPRQDLYLCHGDASKKKHTRHGGEVSESRADVSFIEGKVVNYSRADERCLLYLEGHERPYSPEGNGVTQHYHGCIQKFPS
ncbi:hypothetical protein HBH56_135420 [Parastagonospora nodorum]|uniref:Uncharacterized protein n=1 Tax=Phaeosphaeria nodorum (strain SN15 / ATCC MYA-4574 / FGSC 10173) TaxID=321614 RepID=A0A7U2I417_PHANO|nr:hypothetical protein HBH56_135420 [Parastagonospora nodorum]QRD02586.1 hypothetical protein JI435_418210 [Parastagonospora nodorum SN15]KAH3927117.1 hypothetical protein HBH54_157870 [Parastagonospora nodorum]KAH3949250.1 hypothetical protein HBH53_090520 [Parastagonospora nodorum]KAH3991395.1 hypothetical protein HBI10_233560 [Parastagonospora nodorum]